MMELLLKAAANVIDWAGRRLGCKFKNSIKIRIEALFGVFSVSWEREKVKKMCKIPSLPIAITTRATRRRKMRRVESIFFHEEDDYVSPLESHRFIVEYLTVNLK